MTTAAKLIPMTDKNYNSKIDEKMRAKLRDSFPPEAYSRHPTKTFLTTLKAMYVTERLNDVFGLGRWSINFEIIERTPDYVLGQGEFISLDFEVIIPKQFGGHTTTGKNTEIADGYKSALTDCQSKIASYLEIGIDLFKGKINLPAKQTYKAPVKKAPIKTPPSGGRPNTTSSTKSMNKPKPWLNKMKGKDFSPEYMNILSAITEGKIKDLADVKKHYQFKVGLAKEMQITIDKFKEFNN